ncbi:hypothetical protein [Roseinatronobacter sp. S2]|nr:hypothetical protein [Roseinatronobacter sp. S2]WFE77286.1 hypothetical protein P8S53_21190 [Roseinatronobacter sp. S2]
MMTNCFSAMAGFGPGWGTLPVLIAVTAALTYLLTKSANTRRDRVVDA